MGRKGIGKLAGFGIANRMEIVTWRDDESISFIMDIEKLKTTAGHVATAIIEAEISPPKTDQLHSGTGIRLEGLKHKSPLDIDSLHYSLSRRFGRVVKGSMNIFINNVPLKEPPLSFIHRYPEEGFAEETLSNGEKVKYWYGITEKVIPWSLMQGFAVMVREKVAQLPPFYFNVENTASHQHGTKYFMGEVIAEYIDEGTDDESDLVSTDRQEIEWESESTKPLLEWGQKKTREVLNERYALRGKEIEKWVLDDEGIKDRIASLDKHSSDNVWRLSQIIGDTEADKEEGVQLINQLVRAYEFRQFHNIVEDVEKSAQEDPLKFVELLRQLGEWRVIESRAMLEIIEGRLSISDKLQDFIINGIPETATGVSDDNLHDLIARMPWLLHHEWELYGEEKTLSRQLREWNREDLADDLSDDEIAKRYDFLVLDGDSNVLVIEIKKAGYAVELDEIHRLDTYRERIQSSQTKPVKAVLVYGGALNISKIATEDLNRKEYFILEPWSSVYQRSKKHYEHYRSLLEGNASDPAFRGLASEAAERRNIEETGTVKRTPEEREEARRRLKEKSDVKILPEVAPKPGKNV